jgi:ATP-dependent Lon protease
MKVQIPENLPLIPVRDLVVFPHMMISLYVGRDYSIRAIEEALSKNRYIFLASQKDLAEENPTQNSIFHFGTVASILRMRKIPDGSIKILIQGVSRAMIKKFDKTEPYFEVSIDSIEDTGLTATPIEVQALIRTSKELTEKIIALGRMIAPDILHILDEVDDPGRVADILAGNIGLKVNDAQKVLETKDPMQRLKTVNELLITELDVLQMQVKIRSQAKDEMTKNQRDHFLREQIRAMKNELGDGDSKSEEMEELREKIKSKGMPQPVEAEALKQLARLERMHPDASEASMVRTYLDWLVDLPWNTSTDDVLDLVRAKEILDQDHYDLHKIKDRILEFLAVRKLKSKDMRGPILCFAGPPGVGKTSLGKSIARSMGREYFRLSLGGVKDEAEIRGHRRTYVGAMPGKIIQALKAVKTNNPVIVLDEIDKLGSDFRGDPSAAMLEVLDPEQNSTFRDNYLNVDFDLSNVMFIATANVVENIPPALRDRMELIHLSGYTENDKLAITKKHVIDKQIAANGITKDHIEFTDEGLQYLISHYTREAGVRNLEREVGSVCRKVAKKFVEGFTGKTIITPAVVTDLLGAPRYLRDEKLTDSQVGIATGLAWTQVGGEILYIEALKMKGKGGLVLTGQLGDVMKESARAALSYARAHHEELGIPSEIFENFEIHLHIPAGAVPKDGPSAGITLATALISLLTDTPIRMDVAMTGEVTLAGRVLPVGGIREKALAALTHGISTIILPLANQKDISDIPEQFKQQINFIFVENVDEVLTVALDKKADKKSVGPRIKRKDKIPRAASAA